MRWLRLRRHPKGSWTFGYEYISHIGSSERHYWLSIANDEEWKILGKNNLQIILSGQREQLHAIKDALDIVQQHMEEIVATKAVLSATKDAIRMTLEDIGNKTGYSIAIAKAFQIDGIENTIWNVWQRREKDKRISDTYYTCDRGNIFLGDFQEVIEDYTRVIEEIENAITHFEKIYTSIHSDDADEPPVLPWLRSDGHFQRGDRIFGWKASHIQPIGPDIHHYWEPYLDKVLVASSQEFTPTSGFLSDDYSMTSPEVMSVNEAVYYHEHDVYRQFLIEKMRWNRGRIDTTFREILVALGNLNIFDFIKT